MDFRCRLVLVGHLGGLLFDGRYSCTEDSFAGHSCLYCGDFLAVHILVLKISQFLAVLPNLMLDNISRYTVIIAIVQSCTGKNITHLLPLALLPVLRTRNNTDGKKS